MHQELFAYLFFNKVKLSVSKAFADKVLFRLFPLTWPGEVATLDSEFLPPGSLTWSTSQTTLLYQVPTFSTDFQSAFIQAKLMNLTRSLKTVFSSSKSLHCVTSSTDASMSIIEAPATCNLLECKERRNFQIQGLGGLIATVMIAWSAYLREENVYP